MTVIPHQILFNGPGFISGTIGTASKEECVKRAPDIARELKRDYGVSWVSWQITEAKR